MIFLPSRYKDLPDPIFLLNDKALEVVHEVKYLGHSISSDLSDNSDIKRQMRLIYARGNVLIKRFNLCSHKVKLTLFKLFILPIYCLHLWHVFSVRTMNRIKVALNNIN